jgi:CheY-like chemotaxis protein
LPRLSEQEQVEAKIGHWKQAFDAVLVDISIPGMTELLATLQADELSRSLPLYIQIGRIEAAKYRAAATVAALITATGIKPTAIDYGDDA